MWAVKRALLANRTLLTTASTPASGFSFRAFSSEDYLSGTVKFYLRDKAYGFITVDDPEAAGGSPDVWVHRTSLDTSYTPEEFPTRPYLYKNERVKFRVVTPEEGGNSLKAVDVKFENGREIPLFRKNYYASFVKGECGRLGESVLEIFGDETLSSDEERMVKVKAEVAAVQEALVTAERNFQMYGTPEDKEAH